MIVTNECHSYHLNSKSQGPKIELLGLHFPCKLHKRLGSVNMPGVKEVASLFPVMFNQCLWSHHECQGHISFQSQSWMLTQTVYLKCSLKNICYLLLTTLRNVWSDRDKNINVSLQALLTFYLPLALDCVTFVTVLTCTRHHARYMLSIWHEDTAS